MEEERCWEQDCGGLLLLFLGRLPSLPRGPPACLLHSYPVCLSLGLGPHLLPSASASIIDSESGSAPVSMGVSHVEQSPDHRGPQVRCPCCDRLPTLLCFWPRGGGGRGCRPACLREALALSTQLGSSCKLPNTYFGRSA